MVEQLWLSVTLCVTRNRLITERLSGSLLLLTITTHLMSVQNFGCVGFTERRRWQHNADLRKDSDRKDHHPRGRIV